MIDRLPDRGFIDPLLVRFCQNSIRDTFRTGGTVDALVLALRSGGVEPQQVPPIRIFELDGKLYTLDNRRLWAFREAGVSISYRKATEQEVREEGWKFKLVGDGWTIRVRGGMR